MTIKVTCPCGEEFEAKSSRAKFCSPTCRSRAHRGQPAKAKRTVKRGASGFEKATLAELSRLKKVDTMLGQQALVIARRMGDATETGAAVATLSREHSRLMAAVAAGASVADPVDEARQSRERKLGQ